MESNKLRDLAIHFFGGMLRKLSAALITLKAGLSTRRFAQQPALLKLATTLGTLTNSPVLIADQVCQWFADFRNRYVSWIAKGSEDNRLSFGR